MKEGRRGSASQKPDPIEPRGTQEPTKDQEPSAFLKLWWDGDRRRCRVDLSGVCEPWLAALEPDIEPLYTTAALNAEYGNRETEARRAEHLLALRDRQMELSRKAWVRAAKAALNVIGPGASRSDHPAHDLWLRVEMAEMPPMEIIQSSGAPPNSPSDTGASACTLPPDEPK